MRAKTFAGPSRMEVNDEAKKWCTMRKGLSQVGKWARFSPENQGQWSITVRYEETAPAAEGGVSQWRRQSGLITNLRSRSNVDSQ